MIDRRDLLTLGGLAGALAGRGENADTAAAGTADVSDRTVQDVVSALRAITTAMYAAQSFDAIRPIRTKQIDYLKATSKFPDFIDVGVDMWMAAHDWHVRLQQPLVLGRDTTGRYTMTLEFTQLVLRPDVTADYVSVPYDAK
jgi:hypothetical protein